MAQKQSLHFRLIWSALSGCDAGVQKLVMFFQSSESNALAKCELDCHCQMNWILERPKRSITDGISQFEVSVDVKLGFPFASAKRGILKTHFFPSILHLSMKSTALVEVFLEVTQDAISIKDAKELLHHFAECPRFTILPLFFRRSEFLPMMSNQRHTGSP